MEAQTLNNFDPEYLTEKSLNKYNQYSYNRVYLDLSH